MSVMIYMISFSLIVYLNQHFIIDDNSDIL